MTYLISLLTSRCAFSLANQVGNLFRVTWITILLTVCGWFVIGLAMGRANTVGNPFGTIYLIRLLISPCHTGCLRCYRVSHRGAVDDGLDNAVGSQWWHIYTVSPPLGYGLLNGSVAVFVYL